MSPNPRQVVLLLLLLAEFLAFSALGLATDNHFLSFNNLFEVVRLSVELGLLALAMKAAAVILTGGIDLSVGSLLGLCAIAIGMLCRDFHVPLPLAILAALALGALAGTPQRPARYPLPHSPAHRHPRNPLPLPRHRRRHHPRRTKLHRLSPLVSPTGPGTDRLHSRPGPNPNRRRHRLLAPASSLDRRPARSRDRLLPRGRTPHRIPSIAASPSPTFWPG